MVRRASRSNFESQIKEFSSHFADIYEDERAKGADETIAAKKARRRIGSVYSIAFQIINSPERAQKGVRIQQVSLLAFLVLIGAYLFATLWSDQPSWIQNLPMVVAIIKSLFFIAGISLGYGILLSKKILWKPLIVSTLVIFVGGGFGIVAGSQPFRYFHMTKSEAKALVAKQTSIEPQVTLIENKVREIYFMHTRQPEALKDELRNLDRLLKSSNTEFFHEVAGSQASYIYPGQLEYPHDPTYFYTLTFKRTSDFAEADRNWHMTSPLYVPVTMAMSARLNNFQAYRIYTSTSSWPMIVGFRLSGIFALVSTGMLLLLAVAGYMLGTFRILGFDWLRGVRA